MQKDVVEISDKVDIGLWLECSPPVVVPISDRAKEKFAMPDGISGLVILDHDTKSLVGLFPNDYTFGKLDAGYKPGCVIFASAYVIPEVPSEVPVH